MKKGSLSVLAVMALTAVMLVSACGGSKATTSTNPPTTTPPTTTTTPPATTTNPPTTTTSGGSLPATGVLVTTHDATQLTAYATMCLVCHGPTGSNPQPYAPSWNATASSSTHNTGTFTVTAGSPADHTGYTNADCLKAGCHTAASTTPPTTTAPPTTTTPPATTSKPPTTSSTPTSTILSGLQFVNINVDGFQPLTLTVKVGTTITFTNNLESSTELSCDALEVDVTILRGATYTRTFGTVGKFTFLNDEGNNVVITVVA